MKCKFERNKLLEAKLLHQQGVISFAVLKKAADEYRLALIRYREVSGKKLFIPSALRLISITCRQ